MFLRIQCARNLSGGIAARLMLFALVVGLLSGAGRAHAKDHFLTVGGGYEPTGNQLSLERNVIFQQAVLESQCSDRPVHDIFFADGSDESCDVQCRDAEFRTTCPPARQMMAELFGDADAMDLFYRNNKVPNLDGPAERDLLKRRLRELSRELQPQDRLIIYVTGHGGPAEDDDGDDYDYEYDEATQSWKATEKKDQANAGQDKFNTSFYLWDGESITARELTVWLDRLPCDVQVVLVMVQCYAGGFAHTIFHQADANLGLSRHARCGFFAQVHDRGAAGCTPDSDESDYEEYSSYFWGALGGRSRSGQTITSADYDENGQVSFAEAHSYALLESNTIDIPVRTTDALLRKYSHLGKPSIDEEKEDDANPIGRLFGILSQSQESKSPQTLLELKGPVHNLLPHARPDQRAVLKQLPAKLGLKSELTFEDIERALRKINRDGKLASAKFAVARKTYTRLLERVQQELCEVWPALNAEYAPLAMALANERADEFVERVSDLSSYEALCRARERRDKLSDKRMELAHREARLQRLKHTCKTVVLAANLPQIAPDEIVTCYEQLLAMEEGGL